MGTIICGFSGVGKSSVCNNNIIDLDSSNYKKDDLWPYKYVDDIVYEALKNNNTVLCSCHEEVRRELTNRGISFIIIAPYDDLCNEYSKRWLKRGDSAEFIKYMQKNWIDFHRSIKIDGALNNACVIYLNSGEYISDVIKME